MIGSVHISHVHVQILSERHKYGTKSGSWIKIDSLDPNIFLKNVLFKSLTLF